MSNFLGPALPSKTLPFHLPSSSLSFTRNRLGCGHTALLTSLRLTTSRQRLGTMPSCATGQATSPLRALMPWPVEWSHITPNTQSWGTGTLSADRMARSRCLHLFRLSSLPRSPCKVCPPGTTPNTAKTSKATVSGQGHLDPVIGALACCCVTSGKSLHLSVPSPHLTNRR